MNKKSAGILLYRFNRNELEVFLAHPGGPFFVHKDSGIWTIPKGEFTDVENPIVAAKREFKEETGSVISGEFTELTPLKQKTGKIIYAFAICYTIDERKIQSNMFEIDWPPGSGKKQKFPEIDKASWFSVAQAMEKIQPGQRPFISELVSLLKYDMQKKSNQNHS